MALDQIRDLVELRNPFGIRDGRPDRKRLTRAAHRLIHEFDSAFRTSSCDGLVERVQHIECARRGRGLAADGQ